MPTQAQIENRIHKFLGYGNLGNKNQPTIWFIGMEEACGECPEDLEVRFRRTNNKEVLDVQRLKGVKEHEELFLPGSKKQRTWWKLILILLTLDSKNNDTEEIKQYQRKSFARSNSKHCVLELMPLPCKSTHEKDWPYKKFRRTRKEYLKDFTNGRIELFKDSIKKHKPKIVIFYSFSKSYLDNWFKIIGCDYKSITKSKNLYCYRTQKIKYFMIPHPNKWGLTYDDWTHIAKSIKKEISD